MQASGVAAAAAGRQAERLNRPAARARPPRRPWLYLPSL